MEFIDAFLLATAFAYLGCLIFTILGKPPMANIEKEMQGSFYLLAFIIFVVAAFDGFPLFIYAALGVAYSFAAIGSFIGWPQVWMAHWKDDPEKGSAAEQVGMAFWDLAIAVLFFMKWTL